MPATIRGVLECFFFGSSGFTGCCSYLPGLPWLPSLRLLSDLGVICGCSSPSALLCRSSLEPSRLELSVLERSLLLFLFGIGGCHDSNLPFECMNTCSYNFASKGRGKCGLTGQRMRGLENDFAVRLGVGGELNDAVQDLVELGVVSLERQLLGHKVDRNGLDAIELSQLVLKFTRAVGAIDLVELELLFHGGFLSLC